MPQTRHSFDVLYDHYANVLYGVISRVIPSEAAALLVLQQSFETIWHNLDRYNPAKGSFYTWMTGIARHAAIAHLQQENPDAAQPAFIGRQALPSGSIGLEQQLPALEPELQQVVHLAYFKGYNPEEIAGMLELPQETVMSRMRQAVLLLRDQQ
jgi:RNA polymerase sigma factor (sigma-70 family)